MRTAVCVLALFAAGSAQAWENRFAENLRDDFLVHWESTRNYTHAVLDAMPDKGLDFRPTPEQRTFLEQLAHAAAANAGYFSRFEKDGLPRPEGPPKELTRESTQAYLKTSFDYVEKVLKALTEEDFQRRSIAFGRRNTPHTAQDLFLRAYMHTAHHRGQAVVYLRLQGVEPPAWQFSPTGE